MIVRQRPGIFLLFFIVRGSIVLRVMPQIALIAALGALVVWLNEVSPTLLPRMSGGPFALMGIALSIFLSFRNSACYEHWWEARRHWGELIIANRTLARQTVFLQPLHADKRRRLLTLAIAFSQALVVHLRPTPQDDKVRKFLSPRDLERYRGSSNSPDLLLQIIGEELAGLRSETHLSDIMFQMLDRTVTEMAMVQAACERIRSTPVPFGYTLLLHRTAYLFCFMLPFGFSDSLGWATPFAVAVVAYTFFGLDALSDELDEPFGELPNDLPIGALADTIEINVRQALGDTDLPPLPVPKDFVLM
jgi:putative membrane protein